MKATLASFRAFAKDKRFTSYRQVNYTGVEMAGAFDIASEEVEPRISSAVAGAFNVMWAERNGRLILCVWEPWDPPGKVPAWEQVFAERDLD